MANGKKDFDEIDCSVRTTMLNQIVECTTKPILFDESSCLNDNKFKLVIRTLERSGVSAVILGNNQKPHDVEELMEKVKTVVQT